MLLDKNFCILNPSTCFNNITTDRINTIFVTLNLEKNAI